MTGIRESELAARAQARRGAREGSWRTRHHRPPTRGDCVGRGDRLRAAQRATTGRRGPPQSGPRPDRRPRRRGVADDAAGARAGSPVAAREANAIHLLFSLCQERTTAALQGDRSVRLRRDEAAHGGDAAAMGIVGPPRFPSHATLAAAESCRRSAAARGDDRARDLPVATARASPASAPRPKRTAHAAAATPRRGAAPTPSNSIRSASRRSPRWPNLTAAAARGSSIRCSVGRPKSSAPSTCSRSATPIAHASSAPPASGKTSVVRGLAQLIADGTEGSVLDDRIVIEIDAAGLLAGTGVRGALAERMAQIKAEVARAEGRVVLFFDELHAVLDGRRGGRRRAQGLARARGARRASARRRSRTTSASS